MKKTVAVGEVKVKVSGRTLDLSPELVVKKLRGATPGPIQTHAVEVDGVAFPVKEAFAHVSGLDVLDFNTNHARSIFQRLGFEVKRVARTVPSR